MMDVPCSRIFTRLDPRSSVEPLKILDEFRTLITKFSKENNFSPAPKQKQSVKGIEDCDRGLMNSCANGTAGQSDSLQPTHYNSGGSSIKTTCWFILKEANTSSSEWNSKIGQPIPLFVDLPRREWKDLRQVRQQWIIAFVARKRGPPSYRFRLANPEEQKAPAWQASDQQIS
jgi:hypothetical protein